MPPELRRGLPGALHVRASADGAEARIIEGIVLPFGAVATVADPDESGRLGRPYRETMARSVADSIDPSRVVLDYLPELADPSSHARARIIGRGVEARIVPEGLHMAFRVSRTAAGDEGLELARDGVLTDLSANFRPVAHRTRSDGVIERTAIDLRRVAVLESGAYPGAQVTAVRAATEGETMPGRNDSTDQDASRDAGADASRGAQGDTSQGDASRAAAPAIEPAAFASAMEAYLASRSQPGERADSARAAAERETVDALARSAAASRAGRSPMYVTRPEFVYGPGSGRSFFRDGWLASRGDSEAAERQQRHYALLSDIDLEMQRAEAWGPMYARAGDVLSSEIPGAYPSQYLPGLIVNRILKARPMAGFYDRVPIDSGAPRIFPVVSTSTTVAVQSAEGVNPAASDFATTATTVTPLLYGGETAVARQVLDGADPSIDAMLQTDLTEAYMQASETVVKTAVEAGSTASGVTLTAATPNVGLITLAVNHQTAVFLPAERLFLPSTLLTSWATQLDSSNRPLAPFYGPVNADAVITQPGFGGAVLAGIPVALSWASTAGAGAGVGGIAVIGRSSDFAIFESNIVNFQYDQGAGAPASIRIGLWAYLVVGTRRGSRKATGA